MARHAGYGSRKGLDETLRWNALWSPDRCTRQAFALEAVHLEDFFYDAIPLSGSQT